MLSDDYQDFPEIPSLGELFGALNPWEQDELICGGLPPLAADLFPPEGDDEIHEGFPGQSISSPWGKVEELVGDEEGSSIPNSSDEVGPSSKCVALLKCIDA